MLKSLKFISILQAYSLPNYLHTSSRYASYSKDCLLKLRKQTGFPFAFCKEALSKNGNDYEQAYNWMQGEADKRGLSKAGKLASRTMTQGLLGLLSTSKSAVIVEINCETDFVARNSSFQRLVSSSAHSIAHFFQNNASPKLLLDEDSLKSIKDLETDQLLPDSVALTIGSVGENMKIRRALCMRTEGSDSRIASYVHTSSSGVSTSFKDVKFGKYAACLVYRPSSQQNSGPTWNETSASICSKLCQHIVGMNPNPSLTLTKPVKNPDNEKCFFHQRYLLDETIKVADLLEQNEIVVQGFVRMECGTEEVYDTDDSDQEAKKVTA
ncbi:hypothetical protein Ciccas_003393 [Cichlidogyrus casuarinus]|uniref:Elongation factor Ts, mitochondrial n=1 Tax=Cichlidogyrus casuarinus TaxID=1844966 RepID=A0ABD2QEY5_9PLAT